MVSPPRPREMCRAPNSRTKVSSPARNEEPGELKVEDRERVRMGVRGVVVPGENKGSEGLGDEGAAVVEALRVRDVTMDWEV